MENFRITRFFGKSLLSLLKKDMSRGEYITDEHESDESKVPLNRCDINRCLIKSSISHSIGRGSQNP